MTTIPLNPQGVCPAACAVPGPGIYVYCIAAGSGHHVLGPIGLDGRNVYTVWSGVSLSAVVHDCQAQPYRSEDPATAQEWVLAHQRVIVAATQRFGTVLPMAFNTIVHGEGQAAPARSLQAWLDQKRERFERLFRQLAGKAEYGVQVFWDRQAAVEEMLRNDAGLRQMQAEASGQSRGLAHLLKQRLLRAARAAVEARANQQVKDLYIRICACVDDLRVDKLHKDSDGGQMLLNLSCLMESERRELGTLLEEIQNMRGFSVRFTGPWPPYSFVSI